MAGATTQADRQAQVLAAGYNGPLTDAAINQAYANAATPSDLASSGITNRAVSSGQQAPTGTAAAVQAAQGVQGVLGAAASGNKAALDETIREFNQTFGLDTQKFQDDVRRFNENLGISQAGLTGVYQGQQTQAAQAQASSIGATTAGLTGVYNPYAPGSYLSDPATGGVYAVGPNGQVSYISDPKAIPAGTYVQSVPGLSASIPIGTSGTLGQQTQAAQNQAYTQQMGMITTAAGLQANPFRQAQALGQMSGLLGGNGVAGFAAPNTVAGVGTQGGNTAGGMGYLRQMIDDIRDPTANSANMNQVLNGIPTPAKVNSTEFLRSAPSTQSLVLQGMQEKYGLDPADSLAQIRATLPQFQAPTTVGKVVR